MIFFVTSQYYPVIGGVETQLRLVAHELAREHEITVIAQPPRRKYQTWNENHGGTVQSKSLLEKLTKFAPLSRQVSAYKDGPVNVVLVRYTFGERLLISIRSNYLRFIKRIDRSSRKSAIAAFEGSLLAKKLAKVVAGAGIVHAANSGPLAIAAEQVARERSLPFLITPYVHPGQWGDTEADAALYKRAEFVFALLETDRRVLVSMGVDNDKLRMLGVVPILPERVDPDEFRKKHRLGDNLIVLFVGRLSEYKGFQALEKAAPIVWKKLPQVRFLFIGPADTKRTKKQLGEEAAEIDPRIRYLGRVSDQEKGDAFSACTVFCMPSMFEILPAVYLEAWTYGKPVIGGLAHGLDELIEGNDAGVVVGQDPHQIADKIASLLTDEPTRNRMGRNGRRLVEKRFSLPALVNEYRTAYADVKNAGSSQSLKS